MPWNFQHIFNTSWNIQHSFEHALQFSTCTEILNTQHALQFSEHSEIFNMLFYSFQNILKFSTCFFYSFQNMLKISTCFFIVFNTLFQYAFNMHYRFQHALKFSTHFQTWKFETFTIKSRNTFENCVENHVKYFKVCWKLCWKFQGLGCTAEKGMRWLKSCEFSKRKSVLIVGNSSMMCLLWKFLNLNYLWTFFIFYQTEWTCWVFLLPVRS